MPHSIFSQILQDNKENHRPPSPRMNWTLQLLKTDNLQWKFKVATAKQSHHQLRSSKVAEWSALLYYIVWYCFRLWYMLQRYRADIQQTTTSIQSCVQGAAREGEKGRRGVTKGNQCGLPSSTENTFTFIHSLTHLNYLGKLLWKSEQHFYILAALYFKIEYLFQK